MGQCPSPRSLRRSALSQAGLVSAGPEARCVSKRPSHGTRPSSSHPRSDPGAQPQQAQLAHDLTMFLEEHLVGKKSFGNRLNCCKWNSEDIGHATDARELSKTSIIGEPHPDDRSKITKPSETLIATADSNPSGRPTGWSLPSLPWPWPWPWWIASNRQTTKCIPRSHWKKRLLWIRKKEASVNYFDWQKPSPEKFNTCFPLLLH